MARGPNAANTKPQTVVVSFIHSVSAPSDARHRCDRVRLSLLSGGWAVDTNFLKVYAERCRSLAENADEFTRRRLLDLAANYDKPVRAAGPSAATRALMAPLVHAESPKQI